MKTALIFIAVFLATAVIGFGLIAVTKAHAAEPDVTLPDGRPVPPCSTAHVSCRQDGGVELVICLTPSGEPAPCRPGSDPDLTTSIFGLGGKAYIAVGVPPCGTKEAEAYNGTACFIWKVVPCPVAIPLGESVPVGCEDRTIKR